MFLAVLGPLLLHGLSLVVEGGGQSLVVMHGLLIAVVSLTGQHRLQGKQALVIVARGLSSCGSQALEHRLS